MNSGLYNKPLGKVSPPGHDLVQGILLRGDFSLVVPNFGTFVFT